VTRYAVLDTPVGDLLAAGEDGALTGLWWGRRLPPGERGDPRAFAYLRGQLDGYFAGVVDSFEIPVAPAGTPWQRAVWDAVRAVPYGATITYTELAARAGRPGAVRAAGAANGRNPISIVIPCHRIVGTGGALTGYGAGVDAKAWLLALEQGARTPAPSRGSPPPRTTGPPAPPGA
jgi:methylated-DNA-[protein]-cysteine S-methyltransferase